MAKRAALGGNWSAAGSWALIDQSSTTGVGYLESESGTTTVTTAYSGCLSAVFAWSSGAPTIDGIGIRLANRTGTTGTLSIHLEVATVEVAGTLVTINTADLPAAVTADLNGGWIFFRFASPVALANATSYSVAIKTSSANQVVVHCPAGNMSRYLRTTTTGAPAAGDDLIVTGEYTGAGTSNTITIAMDETATTDYGAAATSLERPALAVCSKGILRFGVAASTHYNLKVSGNIIVYAGGEFSVGTVGAEIPRNSSATVIMDCVSNVDFGIVCRNLGTFNAQGLSRTSGKNFVTCKLNVDSAANDTTLDVDADTGWLDNDEIAVASTSRTAAECEAGALNGNASATTLTVDGFAGTGGGVQYAHSGTSPTQGEVILLTRNVVIRGVSTTVQTYIDIKATATVDMDWVRFKWMGSATANKRGIDIATTTGSATFSFCAFTNFEVASSLALNITSASGSGVSVTDCVAYRCDRAWIVAASSGASTISRFVSVRGIGSGVHCVLNDVGGTFTYITVAGSAGRSVDVDEASGVIGTISGITVHSGAVYGLQIANAIGTISNVAVWRCNARGLNMQGVATEVVIDSLTAFGNSTDNIGFTNNSAKLTLLSPVLSGDSTFATTNGIAVEARASIAELVIINGDCGTASGIKTAHTNDINVSACAGAFIRMFTVNTKLGSTTEVLGQSAMSASSFISMQKADQTTGFHKTLRRGGTMDPETTITQSGSHSLRMLPISASAKLESIGALGPFAIAVASGEALTVSVYVRESAAYNGNRCRLMVRRNDAIGITADTVLATRVGASDAAWELMTGTTIAATDDGTMEFYVDCDGTAATGYVYVDSMAVA